MSEFWKTKKLEDLNRKEWESLCDGCGRCCLRKLENEDSAEIHYTDVACHLLEPEGCRCRQYADRLDLVADCIELRPDNLEELKWMPTTCAYRLMNEGKPLPEWHPLVSGDVNSVHRAGISVRDRVVSEHFVHEDDLRQRLIHWVKTN